MSHWPLACSSPTHRHGFPLDVDERIRPPGATTCGYGGGRDITKLAGRFHAVPRDIATCMFYTELDPFTCQGVHIARHLRDRKMQQALLQFFKPENYFEVRESLIHAGRQDLIGSGCDCLIPSQPPKAAIEARR